MKIKTAIKNYLTRRTSHLALSNGLTLIELLIVIAVIGVLAAAVVVAINPLEHIARAKDSEKKTNVANLFKGLQSQFVLGGGTYPDPASGWINSLVETGELKNNPSDTNTTVPCLAAAGETAGIENGYCYKRDGAKAVVYTTLESDKELEGCTGTCDIAYYAISSETGTPQVLFGSTEVQPSAAGETEEVYDTSLVGYWRLDGNANDSTVNGNNGVVNGATSTTGQIGGAYYFDGNDYINYGDILDSTFTGANKDSTISMWFKTSATTGDWTNWLFQYASPWSAQFAIGMRVSPSAPSTVGKFLIQHNNNVELCTTAAAYNNGVWHHLVVTRNDSANQVKLYFDGNNTDTCGDVTIGNASNFYIGAQVTAPSGRAWAGEIDDVRVYNRALSPAEIQDI